MSIGDAVGEEVEHGRPTARLVDQPPQLVGRCVADDGEVHADAFEPIAYGVVQSEDAAQVDVALDRGRDLGERDTAGRSDVGQATGQAGGQSVQEVFHRRRPGIAASQNRRVIGVEGEVCCTGVALPSAVEAVNRAAVVSS